MCGQGKNACKLTVKVDTKCVIGVRRRLDPLNERAEPFSQLGDLLSPAARLNPCALSEFLKYTRIDRCSAEHAARKSPGDAGGHDVLTRQEQAGDGRRGVQRI